VGLSASATPREGDLAARFTEDKIDQRVAHNCDPDVFVPPPTSSASASASAADVSSIVTAARVSVQVFFVFWLTKCACTWLQNCVMARR